MTLLSVLKTRIKKTFRPTNGAPHDEQEEWKRRLRAINAATDYQSVFDSAGISDEEGLPILVDVFETYQNASL